MTVFLSRIFLPRSSIVKIQCIFILPIVYGFFRPFSTPKEQPRNRILPLYVSLIYAENAVFGILLSETWNFYSFTLPAVILLIMYFEQKQNTIRIGTTEIATPR